jgi:glycosidase
LIALRRSSEALATGGFQILHTDDDTVAFLRDTEDEQLIVVGYRGTEEHAAGLLPVAHGAIPDGSRFAEVLTGTEAVVHDGHLPLPAMPQGPAIWSVVRDEY